MRFFLEFLHQNVPSKPGNEMPAYFRRALTVSEVLLTVYFLFAFLFFPVFCGRVEWMPLAMAAAAGAGLAVIRRKGARVNLLILAVICFAWTAWNAFVPGWSTGAQQFLALLLVLVFFDVYEKPAAKIVCFALILGIRILLYSLSRHNPPLREIAGDAAILYQLLNTVSFFLMLAALCVIFSTGTQNTERELRIRNQTLYKAAGTDPLTGLPNRRAMIEAIEKYREESPDQPFSVAIADIDHFKNVNDTYGHNCGDYTLVRLTELFAAHAAGQFSVCRWGGEEFCFFMPGKNVDEAGVLMRDLNFAVQRMPLSFEGTDFSITITIGVEEYDYASSLEDLLQRADEKLYMGKEAGRDRVVV